MADALSGRCLCGGVAITAATPDTALGACHCRMCQRWSGGVYVSFHATGVTVTGEVARYRSSPFSERAFCPRCGSHLWMRDDGDAADDYELMAGLFEGTAGLPLDTESYADRAPAWAQLSGDHRRVSAAAYEARSPHVDDPASTLAGAIP